MTPPDNDRGTEAAAWTFIVCVLGLAVIAVIAIVTSCGGVIVDLGR